MKKKILVLFLISLTISACKERGDLIVCIVDYKNAKAICRDKVKKYEIPISELDGYIAMPETDAKSYFLECEEAKIDLIDCQKSCR